MKLSLPQVQLAAANLPIYFGGSFAPFHSGHRAIVEKLLDCFSLCPLFLLPNRISPFKAACLDRASDFHESVNFLHRSALLQIVLSELEQSCPDSSLKLELCEWERGGLSFTTDTLRLILPKRRAGKSCVLALGWDSFCTLHFWKDYRYLLENCILVVFVRGPVTGPGIPEVPDKPETEIEKCAEYTVLPFNNPCSSSRIRSELAGPRPFSAELTKQLEQDLGPSQFAYILKHGLYS